ncbi:MAG: glycoside hydrolase family 15 protein [Spirochaetota bacterium]
MKQKHTYNLGVVGNCSMLAYIDMSANVKWMCLPRFDSSFIFGSLLDEKKGGEFSITPFNKKFKSRQYYLKNTNILATEFSLAEGSFRVIDFAPRFYQYDRYFRPTTLFRKIELLSGNPYIVVKCHPVGEYGETQPEIVSGNSHLRFLHLSSHVRLTTDISLSYILNEKPFALTETKYIAFSYGVPVEAPLAETTQIFFEKTMRYWMHWVKQTTAPLLFQEQVIRSALILKLHQYEDTGAIIASGTTSLPEYPGSKRTWDYRYCWMRDTYYTLNAFNNIGHFEELEKYFQFIRNIILTEPKSIKPLYTLIGEPVPEVEILPLEGYMGEKPVRIGNDAIKQVQNDVYGQILVSLLPLFIDKRLNHLDDNVTRHLTEWLTGKISEYMDQPDSGLWEFSETVHYYCNTYLFHWAGGKAAEKIGIYLKDSNIINKAQKLAEDAKKYIERCYNSKKKAYSQSTGGSVLDASSLQLITMKYLDQKSDKAEKHLKALERELFHGKGEYFRYLQDDIGRTNTSFIICGFWYAEALITTGHLDRAYSIIENLINCSNHLALLSEDAEHDGSQWGNFPQTYSHVGLINAVCKLSQKTDNPVFL